MPADASIFGSYLKPAKSIVDYQTEYDKADADKNALAQSALAIQKSQMDLSNAAQVSAQRNALRDAVSSGQIDLSNPDHVNRALALAPDVAPALLKAVQESATARAKAGLDTAQAGKATADTAGATLDQQIKAHDFHLQQLGAVNDPQSAKAWAVAGLKSGVFTPEQFATGFTNIPTDPAGFAQWKQTAMQGGVNATEQLKMQQQKLIADNHDATQVRTNAATNANSRANNADTIKKDYAVAGINPDGSSSGANDSMVDAIGQYKVAPPSGMALRNPRMQQILAQVTQKYPDFDATQYGARQVAAKSFSTGKDGQSVQSANTALNHLATLKELAAAQDNGDIRLFNTIANRFATETGGAAPTNLASAVTMVGPEISKAVIGVGGGQGDREKVDSALASLTKGGKGQAAGTIATMQDLFGGRLTEAQRTYQRTTGRNDFPGTFLSPAAQAVLAARTGAQPNAAAVPPDIAAILAKHGGK